MHRDDWHSTHFLFSPDHSRTERSVASNSRRLSEGTTYAILGLVVSSIIPVCSHHLDFGQIVRAQNFLLIVISMICWYLLSWKVRLCRLGRSRPFPSYLSYRYLVHNPKHMDSEFWPQSTDPTQFDFDSSPLSHGLSRRYLVASVDLKKKSTGDTKSTR